MMMKETILGKKMKSRIVELEEVSHCGFPQCNFPDDIERIPKTTDELASSLFDLSLHGFSICRMVQNTKRIRIIFERGKWYSTGKRETNIDADVIDHILGFLVVTPPLDIDEYVSQVILGMP